jgi:hypothetical protein
MPDLIEPLLSALAFAGVIASQFSAVVFVLGDGAEI